MQTLSIQLPDSIDLPKDTIQEVMQYLLIGLLRSQGLIRDEDVVELTGTSVSAFEKRLAKYQDLKVPCLESSGTGENRWAALANRYRDRPNLSGKSKRLNELVREFRNDFSF